MNKKTKEYKVALKILKEIPSIGKKVKTKGTLNKEKLVKYIDKCCSKLSSSDLDKVNKINLMSNKKNKKNHFFKITNLCNDGTDDEYYFYNFKNFADWTEKNWNFQKNSMENSMLEYPNGKTEEEIKRTVEDYYGKTYEELLLYTDWCRWVDNDRIIYGSLNSMQNILIDLLSEVSSKFINSKIPNTYYHPINKMFVTSKTNKKYSNLNTKIKAAGREKELESLKDKIREVENKLLKEETIKYESKFDGMTFIDIKEYEISSPMTRLIISNIKTAKKISTKNFLNDFGEYVQPYELITKYFRKKTKKVFLKELKNIYKENKKKFK